MLSQCCFKIWKLRVFVCVMVLRCSQIFTCFFLKPSKFDFRVSNFSLILITNHLCKYMFYLLHERIKCLWFVKSIILHPLQTFFYTVPVYFSHGPRTWLILCANSLNTRQYKNCPCMWMHIHKPYIYCKRCFFHSFKRLSTVDCLCTRLFYETLAMFIT